MLGWLFVEGWEVRREIQPPMWWDRQCTHHPTSPWALILLQNLSILQVVFKAHGGGKKALGVG